MRNLFESKKKRMRTAAGLAGEFGGGCACGGIEELAASLPADGARTSRIAEAAEKPCRICGRPGNVVGAVAPAEDGGPWFAKRVLSAIAARERELAFPLSAWELGAAIRFTAGMDHGHRASSLAALGCNQRSTAKYDPAAGGGVFAGISV